MLALHGCAVTYAINSLSGMIAVGVLPPRVASLTQEEGISGLLTIAAMPLGKRLGRA